MILADNIIDEWDIILFDAMNCYDRTNNNRRRTERRHAGWDVDILAAGGQNGQAMMKEVFLPKSIEIYF